MIEGGLQTAGATGESLKDALLTLNPYKIYSHINDSKRVGVKGLKYVVERLPKGIDEVLKVSIGSDSSFSSDFETIVPAERPRNSYRLSKDRMYVELTHKAEVYDMLPHLMFLSMSAEKIYNNSFIPGTNEPTDAWQTIATAVNSKSDMFDKKLKIALFDLLGGNYQDIIDTHNGLKGNSKVNNLVNIIYNLREMMSQSEAQGYTVDFQQSFLDQMLTHDSGEEWAKGSVEIINKSGFKSRPIILITGSAHSLFNICYGNVVATKRGTLAQMASEIKSSPKLQQKANDYAKDHGFYLFPGTESVKIHSQIIDTSKLDLGMIHPDVPVDWHYMAKEKPILMLLETPLGGGEQATEQMAETIKILSKNSDLNPSNIQGIYITGKAGTLVGNRGDIMMPNAEVMMVTSDTYLVNNALLKYKPWLKKQGMNVDVGTMLTVLGTSLQNDAVLTYFKNSSWQVIGLDMEGVPYLKAIQGEQIKNKLPKNILVGMIYYASDNPLKTGSSLAYGGLGMRGVKPAYIAMSTVVSDALNPNNKL